MHRPTVGSYEEGGSYERDTPVGVSAPVAHTRLCGVSECLTLERLFGYAPPPSRYQSSVGRQHPSLFQSGSSSSLLSLQVLEGP